MSIENKYNSLRQILKKLGKVVIAYSGGVDSTLLLKIAVDVLGSENVLACIADGPALPKSQYNRAIETAKALGAEPCVVESGEICDPAYSANGPDRCFYCKSHLYRVLTGIAKKKGFDFVICGHNLDDNSDYRPGHRAAVDFGVCSPLADAGLTKDDIRKLSRQLNLPTAALPASPCLASRISYGLEITQQRLKQIEDAEDFLRSLGFVEFRVRHHDTIARIEVHPQDLKKVLSDENRFAIAEKLESLGFKFVTVDLQGFRSGSLNEMLTEKQRQGNH